MTNLREKTAQTTFDHIQEYMKNVLPSDKVLLSVFYSNNGDIDGLYAFQLVNGVIMFDQHGENEASDYDTNIGENLQELTLKTVESLNLKHVNDMFSEEQENALNYYIPIQHWETYLQETTENKKEWYLLDEDYADMDEEHEDIELE